MTITEAIVNKLLAIIKDGLCHGAGSMNAPGQFCIQQAVSEATGRKSWSDHPMCVGETVRSFGIHLNDCDWSDKKTRANGMRRLAVAELGSNKVPQREFNDKLCDMWSRKHPMWACDEAGSLPGEVHGDGRWAEMAEMAVQVLIELKSPGTEYLYLIDAPKKVKKEAYAKMLADTRISTCDYGMPMKHGH